MVGYVGAVIAAVHVVVVVIDVKNQIFPIAILRPSVYDISIVIVDMSIAIIIRSARPYGP